MEWALLATLATPVLKWAVTGAVAVATPYLIYYVKKHTGIDISYAMGIQNSSSALQNVQAVEEWSKAREKLNKAMKPSSEEKFERAVRGLLEDRPGISVKEAEKLITATVAATPGVGATGYIIDSEIPTDLPGQMK